MKLAKVVCGSLPFALLVAAAPPVDSDIAREGTGSRRDQLNAMELKPAPADLWGALTGWTNGTALSADATDGKVVVIVTWSSWYKTSHAALKTAQGIADRFGPQGVIVLGVHDAKGFDKAGDVAKEKGVSFLVAHDSEGRFRQTLHADQDPDFYILDRAGQLRYADIVTDSVERAVAKLVAESPQDAASVLERLKQDELRAQEAAGKTKAVSDKLRPGELLNVSFTTPSPDAYTAAKWPAKNEGDLAAGDHQSEALPGSIESATWLTEAPKTAGRVTVLDFWATWCGPCKRAMPKLDELQNRHRQDLAIVAISGQPASGYPEDAAAVKKFLSGHKSAYFHANDMTQSIYKSLEITAIPHVVVISTDGVIRWQGNPHDPKFVGALEQVINVDPGVKARRAAEKEYLRTQSAG